MDHPTKESLLHGLIFMDRLFLSGKSNYAVTYSPLKKITERLKIQKRAVKFYNHLKGSDSQTFHNKAITYRETNLEKSPLSKLVLGLCSETQTHPTEPQDSSTIRPNQIKRKHTGKNLQKNREN